MLEIFLVVYLSRRIKGIVEPKGYKPGKWQAYTIITWIGAEILGVLFSVAFMGPNTLVNIISGYLCAIGATIFLHQRASNLPDINMKGDEWIDNMGVDPD